MPVANNTFNFEFYDSAVRSSWIACVERQMSWHVIHTDVNRLGLDSVVGIATSYMLDVPGIEFQWEWDFPQSSRLALGPTLPPVQRVPDHSPGKGVGLVLTTLPI
jgi:hypothetical protein